jgi:hypothetical protein
VFIQSSPTVKPIIFVGLFHYIVILFDITSIYILVSATYGITPTGKKARLDWINRQLITIQGIEHIKRQGIGQYNTVNFLTTIL